MCFSKNKIKWALRKKILAFKWFSIVIFIGMVSVILFSIHKNQTADFFCKKISTFLISALKNKNSQWLFFPEFSNPYRNFQKENQFSK